MKKIGEVAECLGLSVDTLRYYEKINLLEKVQRTSSGLRLYSYDHLSTLRFIKRAQKMGFSLEEIRQLLSFRNAPAAAKPQIRALAREKLEAIIAHINELSELRGQIQELIEQCETSKGSCPIIQRLDLSEPD